MAYPDHRKILEEGIEAWNKWRRDNPNIKPDLSGVDLRETDLGRVNFNKVNLYNARLSGANLCGANLSGANISKAMLKRATLTGATLSGADLNGANLDGADFSQANLVSANFNEAVLTGTNFIGARLWFTTIRACNMSGANFTKSRMNRTIFAEVDLSTTHGLEKVEHQGPSTVGIDTVHRSQGKIPEIFLRGAGVSDDFIAFIRAVGGAIQFYSCFISYSTKDQLFAERIYAYLQAKGVRCWFAPHDVQGGKQLHEQIDNAIQVHERLLLILSPSSIQSEWVKTEIAKARKREVLEKRRMLFPVLLKISYKKLQEWECFDADTGKDSAREIREYYIPDFSQWELPEKFKEEFEKLVRDLKKAEAAK
jgi:hypothetical protein